MPGAPAIAALEAATVPLRGFGETAGTATNIVPNQTQRGTIVGEKIVPDKQTVSGRGLIEAVEVLQVSSPILALLQYLLLSARSHPYGDGLK